MTPQQAKALTPGTTLCWDNDKTDEATVIAVTETAVTVKWLSTGMIGVYKYGAPSIASLTMIEERKSK